MAFFNNTSNFNVNGGEFYNVQGDMYQNNDNAAAVMNGSYNRGRDGARGGPSNTGRGGFTQNPSNPQYQGPPNPQYRGPSNPQYQGPPNPQNPGPPNPQFQGHPQPQRRSYTQPAANLHNNQNTWRGPQYTHPNAPAPNADTELPAQIRRLTVAGNQPSAPPMHPSYSGPLPAREYPRDGRGPPWGSAQPLQSPISRRNNSRSTNQYSDDEISSSPEEIGSRGPRRGPTEPPLRIREIPIPQRNDSRRTSQYSDDEISSSPEEEGSLRSGSRPSPMSQFPRGSVNPRAWPTQTPPMPMNQLPPVPSSSYRSGPPSRPRGHERRRGTELGGRGSNSDSEDTDTPSAPPSRTSRTSSHMQSPQISSSWSAQPTLPPARPQPHRTSRRNDRSSQSSSDSDGTTTSSATRRTSHSYSQQVPSTAWPPQTPPRNQIQSPQISSSWSLQQTLPLARPHPHRSSRRDDRSLHSSSDSDGATISSAAQRTIRSSSAWPPQMPPRNPFRPPQSTPSWPPQSPILANQNSIPAGTSSSSHAPRSRRRGDSTRSSRSGPGSEDETSSSTPIRRHSGTSSRPAPSASAPASPRALANDAANSEEATRRIAAEEAERARLAVENAERERIAAEKAERARQEKEARVKAEEQECARIEAERIAPAEAALAQTDNTRSDSQFSTSLHPTQPALAPGRSDDNTLHPASNSEDAAITHTPTRQIDAYFGTVKQILHKQLQNLLSGKGLAQQQWNRQRDGSRSGSDYNLRSISHSENTSTSAVPEPQTDCTSSGSELSSSSPQTSDTGDDSDGEQAFNTNWIVVPLLDGDTTPTKVVIYAALLSFLKGACNTKILGSRKVASLQTDLDGYLVSMAFDSVVTAIVESLKCRKTLLELSSKHGFSNDPKLRTALRIDEERIASLLVSVFDSKSAEDAVLRLEGDSAECFLDVVQDTLDKGLLAQEHSRMAQRLIRKVSESSDRLPPSLFITGVSGREEHPTFGGAQGEIYRASYGDKPVALKHMRYRLRGTDLRRIRSKFCREALIWKDLHHPNILPFLGIDRDSFPSCDSLCMVSPWMKNGTVMNYLKVYGHANVDKLLYEIAQGLQYLHSRNIVHGDLKGENILVNEDWSASLADFGLSLFSDATSTTSTRGGGTLYWMAPELHGNIGLAPSRRTPSSDVYAFGCVCMELYTGRPPFGNLSGSAALLKTVNGERPERPPGPPAMSDLLWQHVTEFWAHDPSARPQTHHVVESMVWPAPDSNLSTASSP